MTRLITIFDKDLNQRVFRLFEENEIEEKVDTNLTISASSASIDVGNNVELTGVLTDENSVPLGGMSIRILKNNVLVDTVTTNSSGVYSKIITGLDVGTYHFHASYAGNDVYDNALSQTIDVSVVRHTYAVTITADKQSILTTESVTVTGTVTRDGTGYSGQTVRLFDDGTLIDTLTTDSNGDYTKTVSNLTQGTHRFYSQFDVYESSIILVEVVEHNYSIDIVADNPIIQSGDTSIITATLLDGIDPVINESLSYILSNKGTVVGSGSALTNSNGQITINYVGAGLGDIDVEVSYGTLLQETFVLWDTFFYDNGLDSDYNPNWENYNNYLNIARDNLGTLLTNTSGNTGYWVSTRNFPSSFVVEFDIISVNGSTSVAYSSLPASRLRIDTRASGGDKFKIEYNNNENKIYVNEELISTNTTSNEQYISLRLENNASFKYKNFKLYSVLGYDLTLSSDKDILSAHDGESATVTALLTENSVPIGSVELEYSVKHDNTVIDSGTVTTDSNGEANIVYTATGVGDVNVEVSYSTLLTKIYELEDCWNTQISEISIGSGQTVSSIGMDTVHNVQNEDFTLIFDHKGNGNLNIGAKSEYNPPSTGNYRLTLGTYSNKHYCGVRTSSTDEASGTTADNNTYYTYKIEKQGTTVKFYVDDTLLATKTVTFFNDYSEWSIYNIKWGSGADYMKNIRLKAL